MKNTTLNKSLEVLKYYRKNKTIGKCCEHFGITTMTVYHYLKIAGLTFYNTRNNTKNKNYFEKIDSESKAYYLGFITADGNISKETNRISFTINSKDDYIFKRLKKELRCINKIRRYRYVDKRTNKLYLTSIFQFSSNKLKQDLKRHGVDENKSISFTYPKIPPHLFRHFLRGLFDGDGYVGLTKSTARVSIISTKEFLSYINRKLFKNEASITAIERNKNVWKLHILNIGSCVDFLNYLYNDANIFLKRKHKTYLSLKKVTTYKTSKIVQVLVYNKKGSLRKSFLSLKDCALHYKMSPCHLCNYHLNKGMPKNGLYFKRGNNGFQHKKYISKSYFNKP